ncbi:hypothetical protein [Neptunomonas sp. XY-337]|uniref:hypothetical protein n=1 Tax=Neptunomonas sp. XY-337 TaxID=2561897 RepID=UPI0010AB2643|nr:hypothetical protein [Neptunomonas sp. XY-337]
MTENKDILGDIVTNGFLASIVCAGLYGLTGERFFAGLSILGILPFMAAVLIAIFCPIVVWIIERFE